MSYALNSKHTRKIRRVLLELLDKSEADACVVCDQAGHVLVEEGIDRDPQLISALGAGVFAATRELAGLLGENEFSSVVHQGTRKSILICAIDHDTLLLVVFGPDANFGLVKLYAPTAAGAVRSVLERAREDQAGAAARPFVLRQGDTVFRRGAADE